MKIALDAMGGDFAPRATVEGAVMAARELGLEIVLVGDQEIVQRELHDHDTVGLKLSIEHAPETVAMDESPIAAVLVKPHSSIHVCYELLRRGAVQAAISAGNSGAMMTIGIALMGNLPGVDRPAIASLVPASDELTLLIDAGANTEVKSNNLVQFAAMGSAYMHHLRGIERPRVALLANGEEESKGNDATRGAAAILRGVSALNYVGYIEGRDINHGRADVVVTDGFTGNVVLKTMEGFARFAMGGLREIFTSGMRSRLGYLLIRKRLAAMRERFDPSEYGGAPLLGINGAAFIAHGSSNPKAIRNALRVAANDSLGAEVNREITHLIGQLTAPGLPAPAAGKGFRAILNRMRDRLQRRPRDGDGFAAGSDGIKAEPASPEATDHAAGLNGSTPVPVDGEWSPALESGTTVSTPSTLPSEELVIPDDAGEKSKP